jgi:hypothetical protein
MEWNTLWAADIWAQIRPLTLSIVGSFKEKPIEALTLLIAFFALWTWKSTINAEANIRLRENILDTISDWEIAVINACVASQSSRRQENEQKAIEEASAFINTMSARLQKLRTLVDHTILGNRRQSKILSEKLATAITLNADLLEIIKTKWHIDATNDNSVEDIKQLFSNLTSGKKPSDLVVSRFTEVPQTINSIARATDFLISN